MARQNETPYADGLVFEEESWQELGFHSREEWQEWQHWLTEDAYESEVYADPEAEDKILEETASSEDVGSEDDAESGETMDPEDEAESDGSVEFHDDADSEDETKCTNVKDARNDNEIDERLKDQPYDLPPEVYDHLLELPRSDEGDGDSRDFPRALIWRCCHMITDGSDDQSSSSESIESDQIIDTDGEEDTGSECEKDDSDKESSPVLGCGSSASGSNTDPALAQDSALSPATDLL